MIPDKFIVSGCAVVAWRGHLEFVRCLGIICHDPSERMTPHPKCTKTLRLHNYNNDHISCNIHLQLRSQSTALHLQTVFINSYSHVCDPYDSHGRYNAQLHFAPLSPIHHLHILRHHSSGTHLDTRRLCKGYHRGRMLLGSRTYVPTCL